MNSISGLLAAGLPLFAAALAVSAAPADSPELQPAVWPRHPRLIATDSAWVRLRTQMESDPTLSQFVEGLLSQARRVVNAPVLERRLQGRRLLGVSREALRRVLLCSFAYRMTGDQTFLARAESDMLAAAGFADWNPSHFLDVAEMASALALGYDWLHGDLSGDTRTTVRRAMVDKALVHGRNGHPSFRTQNNWNQVCIGGLGLAALAIADEEPDLARSVLEAGRRNIENGLRAYRPDGIYPEGPSYWEYGTSFTVLLVTSLRSAIGQDWQIPRAEGLKESASWVVHMTGPSGSFYNFADGSARSGLMPSLFFFARELNQPALLRFQQDAIRRFIQGGQERLAPLAAFWWAEPNTVHEGELPLFWSGRGAQPVAVWRSSWSSNAFYFAIKAGGAAANHAHMDGGSFVLEAEGIRWAEDLGAQDYNSLESRGVQLWSMAQDSPRWRVFRLGPFSHNTLTIGGALHNAKGMAALTQANAQGATLDLTPIFQDGQVTQATRKVEISDESVVLEDRVEGAAPGTEIRWAMATRALIALQGEAVTLSQNGRQFPIRFVGATAAVKDISQPATDLDASNPGMRLLTAATKADANGRARFRVILGPDSR